MSQTNETILSISKDHPNFELANRFNKYFAEIQREVEFSMSWHNGTGYFDMAVKDAELNAALHPGDMAKCVDNFGRKLIFVGTRFGVVVVFQRAANNPDSRHCVNLAGIFQRLNFVNANNSPLTRENANQIFGSWDSYNVGQRIEDIATLMLTGEDPTDPRVRSRKRREAEVAQQTA